MHCHASNGTRSWLAARSLAFSFSARAARECVAGALDNIPHISDTTWLTACEISAESLPSLSLRSPAAEATIAPRVVRKTTSAAESFRQSCSMASRNLADCLDAESSEGTLACSTLASECAITISNGTLCLPPGHVLVVDGREMALRDVTVTADAAPRDAGAKSMPLLYAARGALTLQGVTISGNARGHGLGIGRGAAVNAHECHFVEHWTCGAVVRGADAALRASSCRFSHNGQDGVSVSGGAAAQLQDCVSQRNAMLGVAAAGAGTRVSAERCSAVACEDHGFAVSSGAHMTLSSCEAESNNTGMLALGEGARLDATECIVRDNRQGVHAREGAYMSQADGALSRNRVGACVCDAGTRLEAARTSVLRSAAAGVQVFAGGACTFEGGSVARSAGHGVAVKHSCSKFEASGTALTDNGMAGVHVSVMAAVELRGCRLTSNKVSGLQATVRRFCIFLSSCLLQMLHLAVLSAALLFECGWCHTCHAYWWCDRGGL